MLWDVSQKCFFHVAMWVRSNENKITRGYRPPGVASGLERFGHTK